MIDLLVTHQLQFHVHHQDLVPHDWSHPQGSLKTLVVFGRFLFCQYQLRAEVRSSSGILATRRHGAIRDS